MPTKAECLDAAAEVFLRAVIRIEQEELDRKNGWPGDGMTTSQPRILEGHAA
jgi:hypothetical protein